MNEPDYKYYPALSDLINVDDLPDFLSFAKEKVNDLFGKLYYKDYTCHSNIEGSQAFYELDLVSKDRLDLPVPGTDMMFVLNPDKEDNEISSFPISLVWEWKIMRYIKQFKHSNFSGSPKDFFHLAMNVLDASEEQILEMAEQAFVENNDSSLSNFDQMLADINALYGSNIIITEVIKEPTETDDYNYSTSVYNNMRYSELSQQLKSLGKDPYLTIFTLYVLDSDLSIVKERLNYFFAPFIPGDWEEYFKSLLIPKVSASLNDITAGLEFPRKWLKPLYYDKNNLANPNNNKRIGEEVDWNGKTLEKPFEEKELEKVKSMLTFNAGSMHISTETGFEFENENSFSFTKSEIGNTGLKIMFDNMKLDLSRNKNIPEASAAGYPDDFVGVFVEKASIGLPEGWLKNDQAPNTSVEIVGRNMLIGTGGISGTIGLERSNAGDLFHTMLGEFDVALSSFDITFKQNKITASNIHGKLSTDKFSKDGKVIEIEIEIGFDDEGNFHITAKKAEGIPFTIFNVLTIKIKSLTIGREDKRFYMGIGGQAILSIGSFEASFGVENLILWDNGTMELRGADGGYKLKEPIILPLGPAEITVTAIHMGAHEQEHGGKLRKYWFFGFDGGLSLNPLGIDARGDGIKFYFTVDKGEKHTFLRIQSIHVDLVIPGNDPARAAVLISGYLGMKGADNSSNKSEEYSGNIDIVIPKFKLGASANMTLSPSAPAYLVDMSLNLPKSIPLGASGIGIYGFRGLIGSNYMPSKTAAGVSEEEPWYSYYKAPKEGININKFAQKKGFSGGAGVTLATAFDGGKVFSSKLFLMLSLPGQLFLEGKGGILRERIDLDTKSDPPFSALVIIDDSSVTANFGVNLMFPEGSGKIADINGAVDMKFTFGSASSWYVNIGKDEPNSARVQAKLFTLFNAYSYFMLNKSGIRAGARASWNYSKKFGPFKIELGAYINLAGKLSIKPMQIGASISAGGRFSVSISRFKLGFSLDTGLSAEAPKPFIIAGWLSFSLPLPWPLKKLRGPHKIQFEIIFNEDLDKSEIPLLDHTKVRAVNMMSGETFPVAASKGALVMPNDKDINNYIIPVDSYLDIEFMKSMNINNPDLNKFGSVPQGTDNMELIAPQDGKKGQVKHEFLLNKVNIYSRDKNNNWQDYKVHEALIPSDENSVYVKNTNTNLDKLKCGYWLGEDPGKNNKLRILAESELSYMGQAQGITPEEMGFKDGFLFCQSNQRKHKVIHFENSKQDYKLMPYINVHESVAFKLTGSDGTVIPYQKTFNRTKGLALGKGTMVLSLDESYANIHLKLKTLADSVRVSFLRKGEPIKKWGTTVAYNYEEITSKVYTPQSLEELHKKELYKETIVYDYSEHNFSLIDKIIIQTIDSCPSADLLLQEFEGEVSENGDELLQENTGNILLENGNPYNCHTILFEIGLLNETDYSYNHSIKGEEAINADIDARRKGFNSVLKPIWRPDTVYRIEVQTLDKLTNTKTGKLLAGEGYKNTYNFVFKTAGPLGHFHKCKSVYGPNKYRPDYLELLKNNQEDQFRLSALKHYINMDRSYPNANGRLTNAKPLFYKNPELHLFYNQRYVATMFNNLKEYNGCGEVKSSLQVLIKDPAEPLTEGFTPGVRTEWYLDDNPKLSTELQMINNLDAYGARCLGEVETVKPLSAAFRTIPNDLIPDKLYTAVFNAVYQGSTDAVADVEPIHSYSFKTSRYGDFSEQVKSCCNNGTDRATTVFEVAKGFDADTLSKAESLLNGTTNPETDDQITDYSDVFNRLMDGVLKIGALPPAVSTDFNIIKNTNTGNILGILIRNPEPFNDPKIPVDSLIDKKAIELKYNNDTENIKVVFSKDNSQIFISNAAMNLLKGNLTFSFGYLQFVENENGGDYQQKDTESVTIAV